MLIFFVVALGAVFLAQGMKKMGRLTEIPVDTALSPKVSIVIPVCNEEENIEATIRSLVNQEYSNLEIIIVNDRSTDGTAAILCRLQQQYPQLQVEEIERLPKGWMGKHNALQTGAHRASGDYIIFTDGDVQLEKTVIGRGVSHMEKRAVDHLSLIFTNMTPGWLLNCFILDAGMGLLLLFRPWKAKEPLSSSFMGVGAFNMVRKTVYETIEGHQSIKMHPVDDLVLGKIVKEKGYCQDCLLGEGLVTVPWYDSMREMSNGLLKNIFAVVHYRILCIPVMVAAVAAVAILPFWALLFGGLAVKVFSLLTIGVRTLLFYYALQAVKLPWFYLPGLVITPYLSCYIIVKAAWLTVVHKGIFWRGQYYQLSEIKASKPLFF